MRIWNTSDKMNKDTEGNAGRKRWQVILCAVLVGVLCLGLVGTLTAGGILETMAQNNLTDSEAADSEDGLLTAEILSENDGNAESDGSVLQSDAQTQEDNTESGTADNTGNGTEEETDSGTKPCYDYTDVIEVPDVEFPYYIKVNRLANCVTVYTLDEDGEYTVPVKAMVCSVGMDDRTPLGVYTTSDKYDWRYLYGDVYGQYAYRITGSILFHSVPYYTMNKDDLETEEYNKLGEAASLGCVRLSCADAKWLIDNCPSGTTVEIYDDEDPGPLGKPEAITIDTDSPYAGWDPTDPDPENPWNQTEDDEQTSSEEDADTQLISDDEETASENSTDSQNLSADNSDDGVTSETVGSGTTESDSDTASGTGTDTDTGSGTDAGSSSDARTFNTPKVQVIADPFTLSAGQEDNFAELMEENLIITCEDDCQISLSYASLKEAFENHWYGTYTCMVYIHNTEDGSMTTVSVEVKYLPY